MNKTTKGTTKKATKSTGKTTAKKGTPKKVTYTEPVGYMPKNIRDKYFK